MKKIVLFSVIISGLALISCKKDHLCACTTTTTASGNTSTVSYDTTLTDLSQSDAETRCNSLESSGSFGGYSWDTNCELK